MRILHISDTHGLLPTSFPLADVIVHSGDLMPNRTRGIRPVEETYQTAWILANAEHFKRKIGDTPFLFVQGNHDFIDPVPLLVGMGINAIELTEEPILIGEVLFQGFKYIKYFSGEWNNETSERELAMRLDDLNTEAVDVLVTHGPMYGVLDRNAQGERCGSQSLRKAMQDKPPRYLLHGHIHEAAGLLAWSGGMIVSNAACTQRVITL
jgi:Icc-related predicted phosphoesterase